MSCAAADLQIFSTTSQYHLQRWRAHPSPERQAHGGAMRTHARHVRGTSACRPLDPLQSERACQETHLHLPACSSNVGVTQCTTTQHCADCSTSHLGTTPSHAMAGGW